MAMAVFAMELKLVRLSKSYSLHEREKKKEKEKAVDVLLTDMSFGKRPCLLMKALIAIAAGCKSRYFKEAV